MVLFEKNNTISHINNSKKEINIIAFINAKNGSRLISAYISQKLNNQGIERYLKCILWKQNYLFLNYDSHLKSYTITSMLTSSASIYTIVKIGKIIIITS